MKNLFLLFLTLCLAAAVTAQTPAKTTKLTGQIVCCEDCWAEADRRTIAYGTPADLAKAAGCIAKGDPTLLAVMDAAGKTTFYQLEDGKFQKPGKNWLEFVGKKVEITGATRAAKKKQFVKVDELNVPAAPPGQDLSAFVGKDAELALKDLFGVEQNLNSLRGRIVVLNFWATWCGPCKKEMPDLAAIQNQYAALGVQVIGAAADTLAEQKAVREFITKVKVNFPIWLGASTADMARFSLGPALPGTAIIGRDGKIVAVYPGVITEADLKKRLETLIAASQREATNQIAQAQKANKPETSSVPS